MSQAKLPPGPQRNLLFYAQHELRTNVLGLILKNTEEYPGISRMKIGPYYFVNVSKPEYIEHILTHGDDYIKGRENANMKFLLGNGLLTNDGAFWRKQRRLIQPLFHKRRLETFVQKIAECTRRMMDKWQEGTGVDIHGEMTRVTLGIVSQTMMSTDASGHFKEVSDALEVIMKGLSRRTTGFVRLPYWLPIPRNMRMKKNREVLNNKIYSIIQQRRGNSQAFDDLLTMLMEVEDADTAERMTDEQLRDELITIFLAGHETTANALSFAFYLAAKHPEVRERIAQEVKVVAGGEPLTFDRLNRLEYTTRVIKEAMRLYPPAWGILREVKHDVVLDGYLLKKADAVVLSPFAVHRNSRYWHEPEKFDPDRFLPERIQQQHKYAYFPFGGGARFCIGNNFAMMEMQIIMAMVCAEYQLALAPGYQLQLDALITLRPHGAVPLTLTAAHVTVA